MTKRSKRYRGLAEKADRSRAHALDEAVRMVTSGQGTKFDEAVEIALVLGVDPKHADQQVRGTVRLPHGTGKTVRVAAFADGEKAREAKEAGADEVGAEDLVTRIQGGWMEFDATVATPDMMRLVGRLGKVLGPRGLMPSPKAGTVTMDIGKAVGELKGGRVEFRVDKQANLHMVVGRRSFTVEQLKENARTALDAVLEARPSVTKGQYVKSACISTSMGIGVRLDLGTSESSGAAEGEAGQ